MHFLIRVQSRSRLFVGFVCMILVLTLWWSKMKNQGNSKVNTACPGGAGERGGGRGGAECHHRPVNICHEIFPLNPKQAAGSRERDCPTAETLGWRKWQIASSFPGGSSVWPLRGNFSVKMLHLIPWLTTFNGDNRTVASSRSQESTKMRSEDGSSEPG